MKTPEEIFICDCGRGYLKERDVFECRTNNHSRSTFFEAWDTLHSIPPEERDEKWYISKAELESIDEKLE